MIRFGVSAFLKMACLNRRPQRTLLKKRVAGRSSGGYDFHRSLRLRAHRLIVGGESLHTVIASTNEIKKAPERDSAKSGLEHLGEWRLNNPGGIIAYQPVIYKSPSGLFQITFTADLGLRLRNVGTTIHIWNTKTADLDRRLVLATLSLFREPYQRDSISFHT